MPLLIKFYIVASAVALLGQAILLWLQLRAYARFRHRSFVILAVGTMAGIAASAINLVGIVATMPESTETQLIVTALLLGLAQLPVAVWGVVLLFRSYGELFHRNTAAVSNASPGS